MFKKDIFTFRGLLKNGIPDGKTYMEIGKADSISVSTFWKDGKLFLSEYLRNRNYVVCRTKWEAQEHIRKWHREVSAKECNRKKKCRSCQWRCKASQWRCKAVKVVVTWEVVKGKR